MKVKDYHGIKNDIVPGSPRSMNSLFQLTICCFILILSTSLSFANEYGYVSILVKADVEEVVTLLKEAIQDKGLNTVNTLQLSEMLNETAKVYGLGQSIYKSAQKIEFCSAKVTHKLSLEDHGNILLCPFAISVYTLIENPETVYISYRLPLKQTPAGNKLIELMDGIIKEATSW